MNKQLVMDVVQIIENTSNKLSKYIFHKIALCLAVVIFYLILACIGKASIYVSIIFSLPIFALTYYHDKISSLKNIYDTVDKAILGLSTKSDKKEDASTIDIKKVSSDIIDVCEYISKFIELKELTSNLLTVFNPTFAISLVFVSMAVNILAFVSVIHLLIIMF